MLQRSSANKQDESELLKIKNDQLTETMQQLILDDLEDSIF